GSLELSKRIGEREQSPGLRELGRDASRFQHICERLSLLLRPSVLHDGHGLLNQDLHFRRGLRIRGESLPRKPGQDRGSQGRTTPDDYSPARSVDLGLTAESGCRPPSAPVSLRLNELA